MIDHGIQGNQGRSEYKTNTAELACGSGIKCGLIIKRGLRIKRGLNEGSIYSFENKCSVAIDTTFF